MSSTVRSREPRRISAAVSAPSPPPTSITEVSRRTPAFSNSRSVTVGSYWSQLCASPLLYTRSQCATRSLMAGHLPCRLAADCAVSATVSLQQRPARANHPHPLAADPEIAPESPPSSRSARGSTCSASTPIAVDKQSPRPVRAFQVTLTTHGTTAQRLVRRSPREAARDTVRRRGDHGDPAEVQRGRSDIHCHARGRNSCGARSALWWAAYM